MRINTILLASAFALPASESFVLSSPVVADGAALPKEFTGDGAGVTPPLAWRGAPEGTSSYALVMHHIDPEGRTKWYWVLHGIPATATGLARNAQGIGTLGCNSIDRRCGYAPPHSKGPGEKTYVLTLYALSAEPRPKAPTGRPEMLAAMEGLVLGSASLRVTYTRAPAPPPADDPR